MRTRVLLYVVSLLLISVQAVANPVWDQALAELESTGMDFIHAPHYAQVDVDALADDNYYSAENFPNAPNAKTAISRPDADLDPITRSILLVSAREARLPHVRYHIAYSMNVSPDFPEARHNYVEVTRYNLGPARRNDLQASVPEGQLAGPDEFGVGPHVSWRFVMAPIMGAQAGLMHASRREVSDAEARTTDCLGESCLSLANPSGPEQGWQLIPPPQLDVPTYAVRSDWGVSRPARVVQELWVSIAGDGMDPLPYVSGQPHFQFVISLNTGGQEVAVTGLARQSMVMDHSVSEIWTQRFEVAQTPPDFSRLFVPRR